MNQKAETRKEVGKGEMVSSRTRHSQFRNRKVTLASGRGPHRAKEWLSRHSSEQKSGPIAEHQLLEEDIALSGIALRPLKAACQSLWYMYGAYMEDTA
jgi:hypothetical protein